MQITVKCPICGSQNELGDAFCTSCGAPLTGAGEAPAERGPAPAKPMYCSAHPREHIIERPVLGFCPACGAALVDSMPDAEPEPEPKPEPEPEPPRPRPRSCKRGHRFYDPYLATCPECGLPLEEEGAPGPRTEPKPPFELPDGMRVATEKDLRRP